MLLGYEVDGNLVSLSWSIDFTNLYCCWNTYTWSSFYDCVGSWTSIQVIFLCVAHILLFFLRTALCVLGLRWLEQGSKINSKFILRLGLYLMLYVCIHPLVFIWCLILCPHGCLPVFFWVCILGLSQRLI